MLSLRWSLERDTSIALFPQTKVQDGVTAQGSGTSRHDRDKWKALWACLTALECTFAVRKTHILPTCLIKARVGERMSPDPASRRPPTLCGGVCFIWVYICLFVSNVCTSPAVIRSIQLLVWINSIWSFGLYISNTALTFTPSNHVITWFSLKGCVRIRLINLRKQQRSEKRWPWACCAFVNQSWKR